MPGHPDSYRDLHDNLVSNLNRGSKSSNFGPGGTTAVAEALAKVTMHLPKLSGGGFYI